MSEQNRFNLRKKLYQESIWKQVKHVANGGNLRSPIVVDLDPTTFCNLTCPECINISIINTKRFTTARLTTLANEFVQLGVRSVIMTGGGEPLLHPGTPRIIEVLARNGISIGLVTNGTMLHRYLDVVREHVDWIRVSVDACTSETYQIFRPNRNGRSVFNRVIRNIEGTASVAKGVVGFSFLLLTRQDTNGKIVASNIHEIYQAALLAKSIGCKYFEIKPMLDMNHSICPYGLDIIDSIELQLSHLYSLETNGFGIVQSSAISSLLLREPLIQEKKYHTCPVAELRTLVTPLGVYVCPYHRGNPKAYLGNVMRDSLLNKWARVNRTCIDPASQCRFYCARHLSNLELLHIRASDTSQEVVDDYDLFI